MVQYGSIDFEYSDEKGRFDLVSSTLKELKAKQLERKNGKWLGYPLEVPQERKNLEILKHDVANIRGDIIGSMIMRKFISDLPPQQHGNESQIMEGGGWEKEFQKM